MEAKSRSSSIKTSKTEKGSPATGEKKESTSKEHPNPPPRKPVAAEPALVDNDGAKPTASDSQGAPTTSETKGNVEEQDATNGSESSGFEGLKPLLIAAGVAVAACAVIVGVVLLARKK